MTYPYNYQYQPYPFNYSPTYQQPQPNQQQPMIQQPQNPQPLQIQNGGFISVRSIDEAQRYAVAPGNAVTFKIEGVPIVCEKSQGFSQLEAPRFEVFDLVKRDSPPIYQEAANESQNQAQSQSQEAAKYVAHEDIVPILDNVENLKNEIENLKSQISEMTAKKPPTKAKKEEKEGEE